jgi:hypothetical protein
LVWLGHKADTGEAVAMKQFAKNNGFKSRADIESCQAEIEMGELLFSGKGVPIDDPRIFPGVGSIARFLDCIHDPKDLWLVYEVGGLSLTKLLFEVKGPCLFAIHP